MSGSVSTLHLIVRLVFALRDQTHTHNEPKFPRGQDSCSGKKLGSAIYRSQVQAPGGLFFCFSGISLASTSLQIVYHGFGSPR